MKSTGEQINLLAEFVGTDLSSSQISPHERFEDTDPNDCFLVVSTGLKLEKGENTMVPVHITNAQGEDIIFREPTVLQIEGTVNLSTIHQVSIKNERALFDETMSSLIVSAPEQEVVLPEGYVIGKVNHMREQYPLERLCHEALKSGNKDQMVQILLQQSQHPDKKLLIPILKPFDTQLDPFTPLVKGEYEDLGYTSNSSSTTTHTPGKMYWVEVTKEGHKWDHPQAVYRLTKGSQL